MKKFSPREIRRLMKRMGLSMEELSDVERVIIVKSDGTKVRIENPTVMKMVVGDVVTYQVSGTETIEEAEEVAAKEIDEEAVKLVMDQTGVDRETAIKVLEMVNWDIAEAIMMIKGET